MVVASYSRTMLASLEPMVEESVAVVVELAPVLLAGEELQYAKQEVQLTTPYWAQELQMLELEQLNASISVAMIG